MCENNRSAPELEDKTNVALTHTHTDDCLGGESTEKEDEKIMNTPNS